MIIHLPEFDPVIFKIGFIAIRYYSLAYILGIFSCIYWLKAHPKIINNEAMDNWLNWAILSVIIGGRLGYVLFYGKGFFLANPIEIVKIWNGGMSFHGGLIGAITGMYFFAKKYKINFFSLMDLIAIIAPIGLFFGRIANFINLELYGREVTESFLIDKYGFIFPNVDNLPRHPSQLYEAFLEGLLLFFILFLFYRKTNIAKNSGVISGLFLVFYGFFRILVENFREADIQIGQISFGEFLGNVNMGQILSVPIILSGIILCLVRLRSTNTI
jgi:phosphatidylglycerol:prolipoprotein diacylglycerol transferase